MSHKTGFYEGRLGIGLANDGGDGTGNPRFPLDVNGDIRLTGAILKANGEKYLGGLTKIGFDNMTELQNGNIGVGTDAPTVLLDISGNTKISGDLNIIGTLQMNGQSPTYSNWTNSGDDIYRPSGNVGIGTNSPNSKLHIKNDANITSGDTLLTGLSNGPAECLRLQGKKINNSSLGAGSLLRFTNTQGDSNNVEYNLGAIAGFDIDGDMGGALAFYTAKDSNTSGTITTPYDVASSNSVLTGQTYTTSDTYKPVSNAFNGIIDRSVVDAWRTAEVYNTSSYTGSTTTTYDTNQTANGEYIQVDIGQTIVLSTYKIRARNAGSTYGYEQAPKSGKLLYSTDGSTWNLLDTYGPVTTSVYYDGSNYLDSIVDVTSNSVRTGRYFRFVIESVNTTISNSRANILELTLLGVTQTQHDSNNIPSYTGDLEEKMIITHAGNVGIGITNPGQKLEVDGNINIEGTQISINPSTEESYTYFSGVNSVYTTFQGNKNTILKANNGKIFFATGTSGSSSDRMVIDTAGKVGIGTTSPIGMLSVGDSNVGGSDGNIVIGKNNGSGGTRHLKLGWNSAFDFCFGDYGNNNSASTWVEAFKMSYQAPANSLVIDSNGNVGIGTSNPASVVLANNRPKLDIAGNGAYGTGRIFFSDADGSDAARNWFVGPYRSNFAQFQITPSTAKGGGTPDLTKIFCIEYTGNVGIGTTSPLNKLHTENIRVGDWNGSGNGFRFWQNADADLQIDYMSGSSIHKTMMIMDYDGGGIRIPNGNLEVSGWISRSAHGSGGFCGSYNNIGGNAAKTNPIYVIGSAYKPTDTTFEDMYGIGYCYSYEAGTNGVVDDSKWPKCGPYNGWGMYVCAEGNPRIFLGASEAPEICLRGTHPTIFFRDTNNRGVALHANSSEFYILNGKEATDSTTWSTSHLTSGKYYALKIDLDTNEFCIGGDVNLNVNNTQPYDGSGYYGQIRWSVNQTHAYSIVPVKQNETTNKGTHNYTKLRIGWHTGIHLGGHAYYGGVAFFNDAPGTASTPTASVIARVNDNGYTWFSQNVGIGTQVPGYPLEVNGGVSFGTQTARYLHVNGSLTGSNASYANYTVGIYANNGIRTDMHLWATSDERIKTNIIDVPDDLALQQVRDIPCRYYNYIDTTKRGSEKKIGFIAQEVRNILPTAINIVKDIIPNEMRKLENISWEEIIDGSNNTYKLTSDLSNCSGIKYRFFVSKDPSGNITDEISKEVIGNADNTFTFEEKWNNVFCYGKEVDDFHTIDKQSLFALNFSATQELDKKVIALESENAELKAELAAIKAHLGI